MDSTNRLSIPLSGSLLLAPLTQHPWRGQTRKAFNSLVWESITGSIDDWWIHEINKELFQFPCLGVYYWLSDLLCYWGKRYASTFQFPCLGVYYWLGKQGSSCSSPPVILSIPLSGSLLLALCTWWLRSL